MTFIPNSSFILDIAKGNISKHTTFRKFGHNTAVSTTEETVSFTGEPVYQPTAATTLSVVSADANDTSAGTGARTIKVFGVDASFALQEETITMNGTTPVTTSNTYLRVFRAIVVTTGTYAATNIGTITVSDSGVANTFLAIQALKGQSETAFYTVPVGYTLYITDVHFSVDTNKSVTFRMNRLVDANDVSAPFGSKRVIHNYAGVVNSEDFNYSDSPIVIAAASDVWITGETPTGTADASAEIAGILVQD